MLYRSPRPRFARPPPYCPRQQHNGFQWDTANCDGNQNSFPIHPSRNGNSHLPLRGPRPTAGSFPRRSMQQSPMRTPMNRPPTRVQNRPPTSFHTQRPPFQDHRLPLDGHPPQAIRPQRHHLLPRYNSSDDYYRDACRTEESEFDPYSIETGQNQDLYDPYNLESEVVPYNTTQTNDLTLVTNKSEPAVKAPTYGAWTNSSSEPVVRNKELDDWVPSSAETRVAPAVGEEEVSYEEYEKWRRDKGVGFKGGVGVKRKMHKAPKGVFTAAGKHPIGALKEKIPTCEFTEECRERNDELKYWKLTASVKFSGYKFLGYGVTMKIAKAEAAIKALTYLDVLAMGKIKKSKSSRISHPYVAKVQNDSNLNDLNGPPKKRVEKSEKKDAITCLKNELKPKTKKKRMKEKSQKWKEKLENIKKAKDEEIAKAKRERTKITGDMQPLSNELTSIFSSIMADKKINLNIQPQPVKQDSTPYNPFQSNVDHFRSVLSNKNFKENPLSAVKAHILRTNAMHRT